MSLRPKRLVRFLCAACLLRICASTPALSGELPLDWELALELRDALWREGSPDQRKPLSLRLVCDSGAWQSLVVGHARSYNQGDHYGRLAQAAAEGAGLRLAIKMRIETDPWSATGALAEYNIVLRIRPGEASASAAREFEGTWEGKLRGEAANGAASGVLLGNLKLKDFVPPRPGEHPRLLLRQGQLPALRAKAKTDWGRKMLERLKAQDSSKASMAAGQGLLYQLTEDKQYAEQARKLLDDGLAEGAGYWAGTVHDAGVKAAEMAIAFDLIHDACDEPYRARMRKFFSDMLPYWYRGADCPRFNPNDGSNWSAMYRSGMGMGALSLVGEPTEYPPMPAKPEMAELAEGADLKVGKDVPVVKLEDDKAWPAWLLAGPFPVSETQDALAAIGGAPDARPENGTKVVCRAENSGQEIERTFVPVDAKCYFPKEYADRFKDRLLDGAVDLTTATNRAFLTNSYLYGVLENEAPGCVLVEFAQKKFVHGPYVWIAGRLVGHGAVVRLGKGRFPVMVCARPIPVDAWTKVGFGLRFRRVADDAAAAWLKKETDYYQYELEEWQAGQERCRGTVPVPGGCVNLWAERWLAVARQKIENWTYAALGDHGWNTEGEAYTQHSYRLVLPFAHCYRNVMGRELTRWPGLRMALPLYAARTIFGESRARMQAFGPGGGPLGVDNYARGFALTAEKYRPAVLWCWNRTQALADAGKLKGIELLEDRLDPLSAAFMFVNCPLEMKEQNPGETLSHVTVETRRGGYVFRNRWQDDDDFVATVFLNSNLVGGGWGSNEAGDFRLSGLGVDWTVRGQSWGNGTSSRKINKARQEQTILDLAEPVGGGGEAWPTFFEPRADGSGVLTMDMSDIYTGTEPGPKGDVRVFSQRSGRRAGYDLGLAGLRSVAVDYSAASGAPGLFVLVDKVTGSSGKNTWQLVTDKSLAVTTAANAFTIKAQNGASLQGTVVTPRPAEIRTLARTIRHEVNYHGRHQQADFARTVLQVPGGEFFFVVMTVQKDAAPEVKIEGAGAQVKATVGRRAISFDGEKIVLASPSER